MNNYLLVAYIFTFLSLGVLLVSSFISYKKEKKNTDAKRSKK